MNFYQRYDFSVCMSFILVLIAIVGIGYSYHQSTLEEQSRQQLLESENVPIAVLDRTEFDWGIIPRDTVATEDFTISNTGSAPLTVTFMATSCGCTTAELLVNSEAVDIPAIIDPGEQATIHVAFDPDAHDSRGMTKRAVRIETNDPVNPFLIINLLSHVL
jgi:hypothetical protein